MKIYKFIPITILAALIMSSCAVKQKRNSDHLLMAVLYQQRTAELKALYIQAYNTATFQLDQMLQNPAIENGKPKAVVVDIDETVLDNSPYEAMLILSEKQWDSASWSVWTEKAQAEALPGAQEFLSYAASKGVEVFYISNRDKVNETATLKNLKDKNFPMVDKKHLILKEKTSSKEPRRQMLMKEYNIIMLAGDNLTDFIGTYDKATLENRDKLTEQYKKEFGNRYIVLPNAMYGDWENALFNYNYKMSEAQKDSIRKAMLIPFGN